MLQYSRDWRVLVIGNWHPAAPIFIAPALPTARSKWGRLSRWIICSKYFLATFPFEWQWWIIFAFVCTCNLYLVSPLMYLLGIALRKHFLQQSGSIGLSALWRKSVTPFYELARVWECKHFWMIFYDFTRRSLKKRLEKVSDQEKFLQGQYEGVHIAILRLLPSLHTITLQSILLFLH